MNEFTRGYVWEIMVASIITIVLALLLGCAGEPCSSSYCSWGVTLGQMSYW